MAEQEEQPETEEEIITRIVEDLFKGFRHHWHRTWGDKPIVLGNPLWHPYRWEDMQGVRFNRSGANNVDLQPIHFPAPMTISHMTCLIITAGGPGSFLRLGLYADNGGSPLGGALLYDSGNINANVTGPINAAIVPALARPKGVSTWAAIITDSAALEWKRCDSDPNFVEIGAEFMGGCDYAQAFGPFTDPCPAVAAEREARFCGFVRVASVQPL